MNEAILIELRFFIVSIMWGGLILIIYDCLRIFRHVIKHKKFFIAVEDIVYWVVCSFLIFQMMYKQNNGIIRAFSILGMLIGMLIYHWTLSELLVEGISYLLKKIINFIFLIISFVLKPFLWILKIFKSFLGKGKRIIKNLLDIVFLPLKNKIKSSKILLKDSKDGELLEEDKK